MAHSFYRTPAPEDVLGQGDIFLDLPVPQLTFDPLYCLQPNGGNTYRTERVETEAQADMQMLATIELHSGIVITQSCDCVRSDRIMIAPLLPYDKGEKSPREQWTYINNLATSLHETSRMYLPDDESRRLPRQIMDLGGVFTFPQEEMDLFIRQRKRIGALDTEGLRYLQFRLAVMFWRVARDDYYWPSDGDIALKVSMLEAEKAKLEKDVHGKEGERRKVLGKIDEATTEATRAKLQPAVQRIEGEIEDTQADLEENALELARAQLALAGRQGQVQQSPGAEVVLEEIRDAMTEGTAPVVAADQTEIQQGPVGTVEGNEEA